MTMVKTQTLSYYTPELKELKLGLTYEEKDGCCWKEVIVDDHYKLEWLFDLCKNHKPDCLANIVRVRHLTIPDIESLHFDYEEEIDSPLPYAENSIYYKFSNEEEVEIYFKPPYKVIIYDRDSYLAFNGRIKNKLELQEILEKII